MRITIAYRQPICLRMVLSTTVAKRSYLLFTLTPDDYMYEVVNF